MGIPQIVRIGQRLALARERAGRFGRRGTGLSREGAPAEAAPLCASRKQCFFPAYPPLSPVSVTPSMK
jgi:hypothetical protein